MSTTMTYTGQLIVTDCWCGMTYAVPKTLYDHVHEQHDNGERQTNIYCPLGHTWTFGGDGEAARQRKRAERLERQLASRDEDLRVERASHTATKGQLTKVRKRAERGVCPHPECKRSFVDVARHVRTKHPELLAAS